MAKDNAETNPITIKPEPATHETELFSWVTLPYCSPPACPFPIKSLALSAHVSPRTIHFRVLDKSPVSGPGRGPPSCNSLLLACEQLGQIVSRQENRTELSDQGHRTQTTLGWVPGWPGILSLPGIKAAKAFVTQTLTAFYHWIIWVGTAP